MGKHYGHMIPNYGHMIPTSYCLIEVITKAGLTKV